MVKVFVLQTDNRPSLRYLKETQKVNKFFCNILEYNYLFLKLDDNKYGEIHPATKKIHIVNDLLETSDCDILVFLDSDAWIQNGYWLNDIINNLVINDEKNGCFSRDPYVKRNTFINSGSFIIKNNDFIKEMYKKVIVDLYNNNTYHKKPPYDQYYISNYIFENKENFTIFIPDTLNTPIGKVLRHNWLKNQKMYNDINALYSYIKKDPLFGKTEFIEKDYYDNEEFPNKIVNGYEYWK